MILIEWYDNVEIISLLVAELYWTAKVSEECTKSGFAENCKTRVRQRMRKKKRENI